jgi:protein-disulfide isomerase-like protein with CxxC motif
MYLNKDTLTRSTIQKIAEATQDNEHTISVFLLAEAIGDEKKANILKKIEEIHGLEGHMPADLANYRKSILEALLDKCKLIMLADDFKQLERAF